MKATQINLSKTTAKARMQWYVQKKKKKKTLTLTPLPKTFWKILFPVANFCYQVDIISSQ